MGPGQFDEPVGISVDSNGLVYVADTWNQRIQVFQEDEAGSISCPSARGIFSAGTDNRWIISLT